jgi:hypothetical protein
LEFGGSSALKMGIKTKFQDEIKSQSSGKRVVKTFTELDLTGKIVLNLEVALPLAIFVTEPDHKASVLIFVFRIG